MITLQSLMRSRSEPVASITIRNLDEETERKLRTRDAKLNRSMEEEARNSLCSALVLEMPESHLADRIQARFHKLGGVDLRVAERKSIRQHPDFRRP